MIRTDLALEQHESLQSDKDFIPGIMMQREEVEEGIAIIRVSIETEMASIEMNKPMGEYITIDYSNYQGKGKNDFAEVENVFVKELEQCVEKLINRDGFTIGHQGETARSVLVAGLGNRKVEVDALGPKVLEQMQMSRHRMRGFGKDSYGSGELSKLSGIAPGVLEETGMEAQEIIKAVVRETMPDLLITVDALAARSVSRLGKTIQLTSTGIVPGSGVGAHRKAISRETMDVPVLSIGIPTVMEVSAGYFLIPKDLYGVISNMSRFLARGIERVIHKST